MRADSMAAQSTSPEESTQHSLSDHVSNPDFQPPELWENFCCLSHSVYGVLLWKPNRLRYYVCPGGWYGKESACNAEDPSSVRGLGRSPGGGNGKPLQYSCLENSMHRGAWRATVHGVTESDTTERLTHTHTQTNSVFDVHVLYKCIIPYGLPKWLRGKETACHCKRHRRCRFDSVGQGDPSEEAMATHISILAGKSHGQRSLADYSPWHNEESVMTEWLGRHA